jgi:rubrerythrin
MNVDTLNKCLRDELSAVETYRQALDKMRGSYGEDPRFQQLSRMLQDHQQAASRVGALIEQMGGTRTSDSGAWGAWSKTVMGTAKLFGDKAALKALKEGEESGLKDYRDAIDDTSTPADVKTALNTIVSTEQGHVRELDRMMESA